MSLHDDLTAAGLPVAGTAVEGLTVLFTRPLTMQEQSIYERIINPTAYRQAAARVKANAISNWATWSETDWEEFFNANLGNGQVAAISNLADAKAMLVKQNTVINALARMVIALRDHTRITE